MIKLQRIAENVLLYETLEWSYPIDTAITHLERKWNFNNKVSYEDLGHTFKIVVEQPISEKDFNSLIEHIENYLNYFPSYLVDKSRGQKYVHEVALGFLKSGVMFGIHFDARYDQQIKSKEIPPKLYHITEAINQKKILKIGLFAKNKSKLSDHPSRIYVGITSEAVKGLLHDPTFRRNVREWLLLEINSKLLRQHRDVRFFQDPTYIGKALYTYENIPPEYLQIIETIKL